MSPIRLFIVLWLLASGSLAQDLTRPDPEGTPTLVKVRGFLIDVDAVSSADQTFTANVYFDFNWSDERLAHGAERPITKALNGVWNPGIQILNQQRLVETLPEVVQITPAGRVTYRQRYWGNFSQPLDLKDFPFDRQDFEVSLISIHLSEHVQLVPDEALSGSVSDVFSVADWELQSVELRTETYQPLPGTLPRSEIDLSFGMSRRSGYFTIKVIIPLCLVVAMSWLAFWINPKMASVQIGTATTTMLTLIAYRFAVDSNLPKISYTTRMDKFMMVSTVLVFLTLLECVVTARLADSGREQLAERMDRICRIVFPSLYLLVGLVTLVF